MASTLSGIAAEHPSLASHLAGGRAAPLPMLSYLEQAPALHHFYRARRAAGETIAEPGRLTIHPRLRVMAARTGVRLSHFLVLCAYAAGWHELRVDRVLVDCDVRLEQFYRRFGFMTVGGGEAAYQPRLGITMCALQASPDTLPVELLPEVEHIARQLRADGEAVLAAAGSRAESGRRISEPAREGCAAPAALGAAAAAAA